MAAHPLIASFPETHFFDQLVPHHRKWVKRLGLASRREKSKIYYFLEIIGRDDLRNLVPRFALFQRQFANVIVKMLDTLALEAGKRIWVEKTPSHVRKVDDIEKFIPGVKFIHIIRNGPDVVASLYEVSRKYPERWSGPHTIEKCIQIWIDDVSKSLECADKPNHEFVRYERLVESTESELVRLCEFIGVDFNESMLRDYSSAAQELVRNDELWKSSVDRPIQSANETKFFELFDEDQRRYILEKVSAVKLDGHRR